MKGSEQSHSVSSGTVPDSQDLERNIQLASTGLPSTLNEGTRKSQPLLEGSLEDKDSGENKPPADMEPINPPVADLSGKTSSEVKSDTEPVKLQTFGDVQAFLLSEDELDEESDEEEILAAGDDMDEDTQVAEEKYDNTLPLTERQLIKYLRKMSRVLFSRITETLWEQHKEAVVSYADLKASIDTYYDENIAHRDQTDKLLLKEINTAVKDDPAMNKKINKAIKTFATISTNTTEILSLVKDFHFATLQSTVNGLQAQALKQEKVLVAWTTSSTNMARNLGLRMTAAVKGQSSSVPPGSVTPTLDLTHIQANVEGENATYTATKDPPSHTKGENDANIKTADQRKLVNASSIGRPNPDAPVFVPYKINGKLHYLTDKQIQEYLDKEEQIKKAEEEARLIAISKPGVIKVVREEAKKLGIHTTTKAGETFKKAQDAEHAVLKRQHT
ncbi:hypothetical protein Tco_0900676 [Tanacetum coccineum]